MALAEFTTFDDIRAVLGVSKDDLGDATLSLAVYEHSLVSELDDIDLVLIADFKTASNKVPADRTAAETRFLRATRLFAPYSVGRQLLSALPLFAPKEHSDGKAHVTRFALDPYKETIKSVREQHERFRARLAAAYAAFKSATAPAIPARLYFAKSTPTTDPVTGE